MKKAFLALAAVAAALSCQAEVASQLYLIGEPVGGWSPLKGEEVTMTSEGVFEGSLEFTKNTFFAFTSQLGSSSSDWNTMNGHRYGPQVGNTTPEAETPVTMVYGQDRSFQLPAGNYTYTVDTNKMTFTLHGEVVIPEAEYYIVGLNNKWTFDAENKFTKVSDTEFTLKEISFPAKGSFKIATEGYSIQYGKTDGSLVFTNENLSANLDKGAGQGQNVGFDLTAGKYDVTFNPETGLTTLKLVEEVIIDPTKQITVYFDNRETKWSKVYAHVWGGTGIGDLAGWPGTEMTDLGNGAWSFTFDEKYTQVIFNNGSDQQTADTTPEANHVYAFTTNKGEATDEGVYDPANFGEPDPGKTVTVYFNNAYNWETVNAYVYVDGSDVNNGTWPGETMTKLENGAWSYTFPEKFNMVVFNEGAEGNKSVDLKVVDNHIYYWAADQGEYTGVIPAIPVEMPDQLYIIGNFGDADWDVTKAKEMTKDGDTFIIENVLLNNPTEGVEYAHFSFITKAGADWDEVNGGNRYGAAEADAPLALGAPAAMQLYAANVNASAAQAWQVANNTTYTIRANFKTMEVSIESATGVENIELDAAEAVYFNLQGQRVANPDKGMYLKVVNGKASKVVL